MQILKSWYFPLVFLAFPVILPGQDLVQEALGSFPRDTVRVEHLNPARLRSLPDYTNLRQRFVGPRLGTLEKSLERLGVKEADIDELVLGWQAGKGSEMELYGLAEGRFNAQNLAESASARGLAPIIVEQQRAYCLEAGMAATCVVVLGESRGVFGTLGPLTTILAARRAGTPSLVASSRLVRMAREGRSQAAIWGVAVGPSVVDWFRAWIPTQGSVQLDWSRVFEPVEALRYTVETGEKVSLELRLECSSDEAAANLRQVLEGLRLAQLLANQTSERPRPFEALEFNLSGRNVVVNLATSYAELTAFAGPYSSP